jgi:SpoIIAA-like
MLPPDKDVYFYAAGVASVRWDEKGELVVVAWEGWADSAEFAALLDAEVRALREHRSSRLLADCRRQKVLRPDDQERADKEWLPRALAAGLKRFAIVLPTSLLATMNVQDRLGKVPSATLDIAYFEEVDEARAWLIRGPHNWASQTEGSLAARRPRVEFELKGLCA